MMDNLTNYVFSESINIELYFIGYKTQGEAIVIFLKDGTSIIWAGIIDCYKQRVNKTLELLKDNGFGCNRKINFLCISHPDFDHLYSLDEIWDEFVDDETYILTPDFLDLDYEPTKEVSKVMEAFSNRFGEVNESNFNKLFFNRTCGDPKLQHTFMNLSKKNIDFRIDALTPGDAITYNKRIKNNQTKNKNDYSMIVVIKVGEIQLVFCGDCEDKILNTVDMTEIPDRIFCFKIPHHGSITSKAFIEHFIMEDKYIKHAICTTRTSNNTTREEVLAGYLSIAKNLYLTASLDVDENKNDFGIIKLSFDNYGNTIEKDLIIPNAIEWNT